MHICLQMVGDEGWMGGMVYIKNLVHALNSLPKTERERFKLSMVVDGVALRKEMDPLAGLVDGFYLDSLYLKVLRRISHYVSWLPGRIANPLKCDFVYPCLDGLRRPSHNAGWIPDFQHLYLPEYFTPQEVAYRDRLYRRVAFNSPLVVVSSRVAMNDFVRAYPERAASARLLNFATYADPSYFVADPLQIQQKYRLPDRFFLVCNQFWLHKNHAVVVDALEVLRKRGTDAIVVCTGNTVDRRNPGYFDALLKRVAQAGVADRLKILGLIPRNDQMQLMRRCLAVIQPSLFEGWSTVVEDAKALGKGLLLSDIQVHREQNPSNSLFFEPRSHEELAELMVRGISAFAPGPVLEDERAARENNAKEMLRFARQFLEIAAGNEENECK